MKQDKVLPVDLNPKPYLIELAERIEKSAIDQSRRLTIQTEEGCVTTIVETSNSRIRLFTDDGTKIKLHKTLKV